MESFGNYLKALRETKSLTLREVEKATDVSNAYLSQLEANKVKQPSPIILHKLANLYGVKYEGLMEKVGYPILEIDKKNLTDKNKLSQSVGAISQEEELELLNYLKFIRSRKK